MKSFVPRATDLFITSTFQPRVRGCLGSSLTKYSSHICSICGVLAGLSTACCARTTSLRLGICSSYCDAAITNEGIKGYLIVHRPINKFVGKFVSIFPSKRLAEIKLAPTGLGL
jgi:hypothetical protein